MLLFIKILISLLVSHYFDDCWFLMLSFISLSLSLSLLMKLYSFLAGAAVSAILERRKFLENPSDDEDSDDDGDNWN